MRCVFIVHAPDISISLSPSLLTQSHIALFPTPFFLSYPNTATADSRGMALGRSSRKRESSSSRSRSRHHCHREGVVALIATIYCSCTGLVDASLGRGSSTEGATPAAAVATSGGNNYSGGVVVVRTCQQARAWIESESNKNTANMRTVGATATGGGRRPAVTFDLEAGETLDHCLGEVREREKERARANNREKPREQ